jgi:uncharacterized protein YbjT (DUF2867 family)
MSSAPPETVARSRTTHVQSLVIRLDGITAADYLTWVWDPEPPALDRGLRSVAISADPLGELITLELVWAGRRPATPREILRSTQFFGFLPQIAEAGADGDRVRLSTGLMQFVAAEEVAATVAELAPGAPHSGRMELDGPEALGIDARARRLFRMDGDDRTVVGDPHARYFGTELEGGELTTGDGARIGKIDFDAWLVTEGQGAAR